MCDLRARAGPVKKETEICFPNHEAHNSFVGSIVCCKSTSRCSNTSSGFERNFMRDVWISAMTKLVFVLIIGSWWCEDSTKGVLRFLEILLSWDCKTITKAFSEAINGQIQTHSWCNPKSSWLWIKLQLKLADTVNIYTLCMKPLSQTSTRLRNSN